MIKMLTVYFVRKTGHQDVTELLGHSILEVLEPYLDAASHLLGVINDILDISKIESGKMELSNVTFEFSKMIKRVRDVISLRLHLSLHLRELNGDSCVLEGYVKDSGIEISQQEQKKLFTAFQQAQAGTARQYGGTGLSLAISKRILLADDLDINLEIVSAVLESTNVTIDTAGSGREAYEMFRANPGRYDLILMDMQMPEVDGLQATRMICASGAPDAESVPIVAMTANVFKENIKKCLEAGMNGHVGKPIDVAEVIRTLVGYLTVER